MSSPAFGEIVSKAYSEYKKQTPNKIRIIDLFLIYILATGVIQFAYCLLVGTFPFNSFLSGFISSVGQFILTVNLRLQVTNDHEFASISPVRAYADYVLCNVILHLVVMNFMG